MKRKFLLTRCASGVIFGIVAHNLTREVKVDIGRPTRTLEVEPEPQKVPQQIPVEPSPKPEAVPVE